ncbi:PTS fructose transporter subunit IIABC [Enterococcus sp. AZ072]|uniref:PTS fructose transporter subunit IIABC n=1 Tax=unclassified Enterococcus TaxID=2608891 RepID=UPI003D2AC223
MRISEILPHSNIILSQTVKNKQQLFDVLTEKMVEIGKINADDQLEFKRTLEEREKLSTTGIGDGIAIPHSQNDITQEPTVLFLRSSEPIEYETLDDQPVHLVFMISVPRQSNQQHLKILAELSRWLMDTTFQNELMKAETVDQVLSVIRKKEKQGESAMQEEQKKGYIIGVTACPTGIAHTYMSAEKLEKAAVELGYEVKIETNGSVGVENQLTLEDIQQADAVVVAADTKVDTARFSGKKLYKTSVSKGIKEPKETIEKALHSEVFITDAPANNEANKQKSIGFYGALMNGVSNMLPLVVAGGILIAISFFWGINSASPDDASYNVVAALFKQVGDGAFALFVPVMAGYIAYAIADRPGFAPGIVGGYLANNGGSGFLGAILAGFLAGYTILLLKKAFSGLPKSLDGIKPVLLYPLLSVFIVGVITAAAVNPVMGELNTWIVTVLDSIGTANKIVLGFVIGAMLAADLGGPINKAAYLFSVGALATGNYEVMAAAMCSGMVPSLATALAATISKKKFTKSQHEAAKANYVLGLSFIAEGAIPFAASDPVRVLPALMIGSGIAGSLSMIFNVTCPAPHGGIFVLPVVGNPIMFIVSLLIGTVVSAGLLLFLKKELTEEELSI